MFKFESKSPVCTKKPKNLEIHGDKREDPYYWLNDRENNEVIDYLEKENQYTKEVMEETEPFQNILYKEIRGRIKEQDESVPYFMNEYWYYTRFEEGKEHAIYCRKKNSLDNKEEILLDVNILAKGHSFCQVGGLSISPNNKLLSYAVDFESRRKYVIHFINLVDNELLEQSIPMTTGGCTWANDNNTIFYCTKDEETLRSNKIHRYSLSDSTKKEVYHEQDELYNVSVGKSRSKKYIIIGCSSSTTSEMRYLDANEPKGTFQLFAERKKGIEYGAIHYNDNWLIVTNWDAINFRLMKCPIAKTEKKYWKEKIAHRQETLIEGITLFKDYIVLEERTDGLTQIRIQNTKDGTEHYLPFTEETYTCGVGINPEFDSTVLRYGYTSMTSPSSTNEYNMETRGKKTLKQQEVLGDFNENNYASKRLSAKVRDGVDVPISLVYHKDTILSENTPLLLYAYGSYGHSIDPYFSSYRLSLLDRGFVYAIAHIRGGEDLGRQWYEDGKMLSKKNTFYDFIDCAKHLINNNFTSKNHLYAMGGSAGGLLMGAIINMEPNLWNGVVAAVPFVDVLTTMLDESIPLTTGEFEEWGNPKDETYYHYIKSYSPYDNVESKHYPNMLVTTGLHDSQVQYWEPAKWVAKLRSVKKGDNILLLKTEMKFGHGGASGRFERIKEIALEYAFLFTLENIHS